MPIPFDQIEHAQSQGVRRGGAELSLPTAATECGA